VVERLRTGGVQALLVLGHDLLDPRYLGGAGPLAGLDTLIVLDAYQSDLLRVAHVVFPARHAAEKQGTLTNHAGRVQRVVPAVEPAFEAFSEGEVLHRLGAALGLPGFEGGWDPRAAFRAMAREVPAFAGLELAALGDAGQPLAATRPAAGAGARP
jgi:predicted molibdopterin-dependent oxidoreductase YjgC